MSDGIEINVILKSWAVVSGHKRGRVGIGSPPPSEKLNVSGGIGSPPWGHSLDEEIAFWKRFVDKRDYYDYSAKQHCLGQLINAMTRKIKDKYCE